VLPYKRRFRFSDGGVELAKQRRRTAFGRPTVQSIDRTLDVLEALSARRVPTGISDLAHRVGLHVSTVHRLLATLVDRGYVRQDPETSRYHLGSRIFALASAADVHLDVRLVARPYLERLMRAAAETANLVIATSEEVVYIDQVESAHLVKMFTQPGMRAPLYCTGCGKVILANRPTESIADVLAAPMRRHTSNTIATREALEVELERIRHDGFALDNEEMEEGVRCVAVPVFDRRGEIAAALSVSGPTTRMTLQRAMSIAPVAKGIALELSQALGYQVEPLLAGALP
jgi:IclR family transcriptional regulator, acetate operon repressor